MRKWILCVSWSPIQVSTLTQEISAGGVWRIVQGGFLINLLVFSIDWHFTFVCCRGKGDEIVGIVNEARQRRRMEAERQQLENVEVSSLLLLILDIWIIIIKDQAPVPAIRPAVTPPATVPAAASGTATSRSCLAMNKPGISYYTPWGPPPPLPPQNLTKLFIMVFICQPFGRVLNL